MIVLLVYLNGILAKFLILDFLNNWTLKKAEANKQYNHSLVSEPVQLQALALEHLSQAQTPSENWEMLYSTDRGTSQQLLQMYKKASWHLLSHTNVTLQVRAKRGAATLKNPLMSLL